jgi:hypothetical protein
MPGEKKQRQSQNVMKPAELEGLIVETLARFNGLELHALIRLVLMDRACYTTANEEMLRKALQDLVRRGLVVAPRPGLFRIARERAEAQPPAAGRSGFFRKRLRSG